MGATGKPFTRDMIQWIRFRHNIKMPLLKTEDELTVNEVRTMFNISRHMIYYWIDKQYVTARKTPANSFLIKITSNDKTQLLERIRNSYKTKSMTHILN